MRFVFRAIHPYNHPMEENRHYNPELDRTNPASPRGGVGWVTFFIVLLAVAMPIGLVVGSVFGPIWGIAAFVSVMVLEVFAIG